LPDWKFDYQEFDDKGRPYTFPYVYTLNMSVFDRDRHEAVYAEGEAWCYERFGYYPKPFWRGSWSIEFSDETRAMEFRLRWC
jgi:hypothetical protein